MKKIGAPKYYVAAKNGDAFHAWCYEHDVDPKNVTYLHERQQILGGGYTLVCVDGFLLHPLFESLRSYQMILERAVTIYGESHEPIAYKGKIVGWKI